MSAPSIHQQTGRYHEVFQTAFSFITLCIIWMGEIPFIDGDFNELRVEHFSYSVVETWYLSTFLENRLNVNIL